ncbi:6878_t:CDS:2 [Scutellospora calospora]|uniref:6878_t:CDS:1 n=1 Tax=Scutellospora calospora TaxID=85575 RepID=A0ACA9LTR5_9GLOM|nr:6878_t:CDS:2 [Scutellospora calospora]
MFQQIIKATSIHPSVILTDSDPAVDSAISQVFVLIYPIHYAYHISQNLHKHLRKTLEENYSRFLKDFYSCRNSSMIATSQVESVNGKLKQLLHNSNISLCELILEIQKLLDIQDMENEYSSEEQFLVADKFSQNMSASPNDTSIPYLYFFRQEKADFYEKNMTSLEQKIIYEELHSTYKKALNKALKNKSKSLQLIDLLQDFAEEDNTDDESDSNKSQQDVSYIGKENLNPQLQNLKIRQGKGHPLNTKRLKSSHEITKSKPKQQR